MLRIFAYFNRLHSCCPHICIVIYAIKRTKKMSWDGLGMIMHGEERVFLKILPKWCSLEGIAETLKKSVVPSLEKVLLPLGNNSCSPEGIAKKLRKSIVPFREQQLVPGGNNKKTIGKVLFSLGNNSYSLEGTTKKI